MNSNSLQRLLFRLAQAAATLAAMLLTTSIAGTPLKDEGGSTTALHAGGISGNWHADAAFDESYEYVIVPASKGATYSDPESACKYHSAIDENFSDGVQAGLDAGMPVHAFWFLVSWEYASTICDWNMTAFQWGRQQGAMFDQLLAATGLHHEVGQLLGDVELKGSSPTPCPGQPVPDTARWRCGTDATNREVVKGFLDKMEEVKPGGLEYTGIYTHGDIASWFEIVGEGTGPRPDLEPEDPIVLPTFYLWLASWGPTRSLLEQQTTDYSDLGFYMFSWQDADDECQMPAAGSEGAEDFATHNPIFIAGWDRWTDEMTEMTC